jgi:hypothetical protein
VPRPDIAVPVTISLRRVPTLAVLMSAHLGTSLRRAGGQRVCKRDPGGPQQPVLVCGVRVVQRGGDVAELADPVRDLLTGQAGLAGGLG